MMVIRKTYSVNFPSSLALVEAGNRRVQKRMTDRKNAIALYKAYWYTI